MINEEKLWKKAVAFHGHECGGLMIGFKASLYAMELLGLSFNEDGVVSEDEELVCISENDACGVDAVQAILQCTAGKGNLLFRIRGKMAFNFYNRKTGKSVRLILREPENTDDRKERVSRLFSMKDKDPSECFDVTEVHFEVPEPARKFRSVRCSKCGELTADHLIRLQGDEKLCLDCFTEYRRFE
ncbi:MAG: TraR/DksA C4-type zinc finger protein [Firmicutes bacterium]|nr:TraR/DksA C4-type zinc finger protein [Bacillota bacterium]